jgi:hypothetical protein
MFTGEYVNSRFGITVAIERNGFICFLNSRPALNESYRFFGKSQNTNLEGSDSLRSKPVNFFFSNFSPLARLRFPRQTR